MKQQMVNSDKDEEMSDNYQGKFKLIYFILSLYLCLNFES